MTQVKHEALSVADQERILDVEMEIIGVKRELLTAEDPDEKSDIKARLDDLKQKITGIKDSGATSESINEDMIDFFQHDEFFQNNFFEVASNPSPSNWAKIIQQSKFYDVPVRFIFDINSKATVVGVVPLHADLSVIGNKELKNPRFLISGIVNPVTKEYGFSSLKREPYISEFKESYFYKLFLVNMKETVLVTGMKNER